MKRGTVLVAAAVLLLLAGATFAQSSDPYDLSWHTVDSGALTLSAGTDSADAYTLGGTAGQPDAGVLAGGGYTLGGGFWGAGALAPASPAYGVYLPLVLR